jgi:hypothetical protein
MTDHTDAPPQEAGRRQGHGHARADPGTGERGLRFASLGPFFVLTFGLTWGLAALFLVVPETVTGIFGLVSYTNPLFVLAVHAPGIVAVALIWYHHGLRGVGRFFRRLTVWRMPAPWWVFLVAGIPLVFLLGAMLTGTISDPFPFVPWYTVAPALLLALLIGPIEEFGWRGVALPLLQRRLAPLWASLVLGGVWGLWHAPAFLLGGTVQDGWSFGLFFLGVMALSVIVTALFNAAWGSLLIAVVFHFQMNNPLWPDIHPWDSILFTLVAVLVVVLSRKDMLGRESAVTEVLPSGAAERRAEPRATGSR